MRDLLDVGSWQGLLSTLAGLVLVSLVAVGVRLLFMHVVQRRRERENRQVNERLRTLIAAYKVLGGSFTGDLAVDPAHLRDLRARSPAGEGSAEGGPRATPDAPGADPGAGSDRRRRMRDAVEAALADVLLLGTETQVRLAVQAAQDMAAGRPVETAALVVSLRDFIREVLDLEPVPVELVVPKQGPTRPASGSGRGAGGGRGGAAGAGGGSRGGGAGAAGSGLAVVGGAGHGGAGAPSAARDGLDDAVDGAGGGAH